MAAATGRLIRKDDGTYLVLDRIFRAPIEEVWSYLSRSPRLASWVGEFTGAPATGAVRFRFAADDASWENVAILECQAPHRFVADVGRGRSALRLYCHAVQSGGHTTVTFGRRLESMADCVDGVRWDYYFDRLVKVYDGGPLPEWEDYAPLTGYYRALSVLPPQERRSAPATDPTR